MAARIVLKSQLGCQLAYREVGWEENELVFSDVVLFDPSFDAHIEKVSLFLDWSSLPRKLKGHVNFEKPHISLIKKRELPEWKQGGWFDFTLSVNEGIVEWGGLARFSVDCTEKQTDVNLDWGDAGLAATLAGGKIEGELRRVKATLLNSFIPFGEIKEGLLSGKIHVGLDRTVYSANLKAEQLALSMPFGAIENTNTSLSYNANLGAKWEIEGIGVAQGEKIPFHSEGKGFFKSQWVEAEIHFDKGFCKVSGDREWKVEGKDLLSSQLTLLQAAIIPLFPDLADWSFTKGTVSGEGTFSPDLWRVCFQGENLALKKAQTAVSLPLEFTCRTTQGNLSQEGGQIRIESDDFDITVEGAWNDWKGEARIGSALLSLQGGWDGQKFPVHIGKGAFEDFLFSGKGWVDPSLDMSFDLQGEWTFAQGKIPFYSPRLCKQGSVWSFDFRFARKTWDVLRIAGSLEDKEVFFDSHCHFLGAPLSFSSCPFGSVDIEAKLPWKSVLAAGPILREWGIDLAQLPQLGETHLHFQQKDKQTQISVTGTDFPFHFEAQQRGEEWAIALASDLILKGSLNKEGNVRGNAQWKKGWQCEFEGKISPSFHGELTLPHVWCDIAQFPFHGMEGVVEGQGRLLYNGAIHSELDLVASHLKIQGHCLENEGTIHLSYSSEDGARFRGLNLRGPWNCQIDFLEYDAVRSHWIFHQAQVYLPGSLLTHRYLQFLDRNHDLQFVADLDFASDFSTFTCTLREGDIPFDNASRHIEDLHLFWGENECKAALHYLGDLHRFSFKIGEDKLAGRLILGEEETPLTIDWEYGEELSLQAIEGSFAGIEASFHAESANTLVGSARLDLATLSPYLPAKVAEVFTTLEMGKGYELLGRLEWEKNRPYFAGILAGKQLELFGFQFRTLLAHVNLGSEEIQFSDVKISDTAGILKIDAIHLEGKNNQPWTIAIPHLTMVDFRPSLLQKLGQEIGPISPLVVRELHLRDFQGLLDEGKTYTAQGQLHFINSYKREETVFDIPANVLSRIVGIDLDLLIPVCGDLTFDLKDGLFHLHDLSNAFSEGDRSEFFLEMDPPPTMDLDWNLRIFIKMKQFVLLKITESFLISIDGKLNDPQFHLQKKRFFGIM